MEVQSIKEKTVRSVIWSAIENFSFQGVRLIVTLVIARILDPKDFGLVGMLTIFIAISQSLVNSGFSQALMRKQDRTETDNSTVFYFNIIVSVLLYIILFTIAPIVSEFYNEPQLTSLMRVISLVVIVNSLTVVQSALFTAELNFKTQAKATFFSAIISGIISIVLAIKGYGVWTLVFQQLLNASLKVIFLWLNSSWRPILSYSWESFKELFSFGSKLLISGLINTIYNNIYPIIIGKFFSASILGHYTQASQISNLPSSNVSTLLSRVTYPIMCSLQDDDTALVVYYRKMLRIAAFIVFPIMCVLAGVSKSLVIITIGAKWEYAAKLLIPLCLSGMWFPIHEMNLILLNAKGRSDLFLKLEVLKKIVGVILLCIGLPVGVYFMCWCGVACSILFLIINTYYTGKILNIGFYQQMKDIEPILVTSLIAFAVSFCIQYFTESFGLQLTFGLLFGIAIFFLIAYSFHFPEIDYIKSFIKNHCCPLKTHKVL